MKKSMRSALRLLVALAMAGASYPLGAAHAGDVTGTVSVTRPGGAKVDPTGVVIYLEDVPEPAAADGERAHPQVRQRDLKFVPGLTVVVKGTTVDFPNDDKVFHNVFSFSQAAKFDLGLYKSGTTKSVTFNHAGVVNLYCNIHPEMISKIKVLDTTYYAVVGQGGGFRIEHVPPGSYPIVGWQAYGPEFHGQVEVSASGAATVNIQMTAGEPETSHLRKDGTPYGRYK